MTREQFRALEEYFESLAKCIAYEAVMIEPTFEGVEAAVRRNRLLKELEIDLEDEYGHDQ